MYEVKVIEDSISEAGIRITTLQLTYPRYIHAELMTHRVFSRNASSSRAIPVKTLVQKSLDNMVQPIRWGLNQPGMQANEKNLSGEALEEAKAIWRSMAETCAAGAIRLAELGLHKQWANRPTEWFGTISVVLTSTDFSNWDELRAHPDAQPEINYLALLMIEARINSTPRLLKEGEWHLPYITHAERNDALNAIDVNKAVLLLPRISSARCCRVSYLKHDGSKASIQEDLDLCEKLVGAEPLHASPFEHSATPDSYLHGGESKKEWGNPHLHGNFTGWCQYRKMIEAEFKAAKNG